MNEDHVRCQMGILNEEKNTNAVTNSTQSFYLEESHRGS
jgi:hypothetical protein